MNSILGGLKLINDNQQLYELSDL